ATVSVGGRAVFGVVGAAPARPRAVPVSCAVSVRRPTSARRSTAPRPRMFTRVSTSTSALSVWLTVVVVLVLNPRPPAYEVVRASPVTPGLWSASTLTVPSAVRLAPERMFVVAWAVPGGGALDFVFASTPRASAVAVDEAGTG